MEGGVTSIGWCAFSGCRKLSNISIPDSVTTVGSDAFDWTAWENNQTGMIYAGKVAYAHRCSGYDKSSIILREDTVSICPNAFEHCKHIESITIPENMTSISQSAFYGCRNLKNINLHGNITSIEYGAFEFCESLTDLTIPESVTSIGGFAFYGCTNFENITIPENVTSIGLHAFEDTAWFDNQPDGMIYINKIAYRFKGDMPENTSMTLREDTDSISGGAFESCENLTSIIIPDNVTDIGEYTFFECPNLANIEIPNSVTSIGEATFYACTSLNRITIPQNTTSIGNFAFTDCMSLESISIPGSVKSIGNSAFYGCEKLGNITIPQSVTNIGKYAFGYYFYSDEGAEGDGYYADLKYNNRTIYGYANTAAEIYANDNIISFIPLTELLIGDLNNDGKIDTVDVILLAKYIAGRIDLTEIQKIYARTIGGGDTINSDCLIVLIKFLIGDIETLPIQ